MKRPKNISMPLLIMALILLITSPISVINADELAIPIGHQGAEKSSLERPRVGMTSATVETKFGPPLKKTSPIGKPPISSWEYLHYNVYFESDRVIHTVLKPFSDETAAPSADQVPGIEVTPAAEPVPTALTEPAPAPAAPPIPAIEATETTK